MNEIGINVEGHNEKGIREARLAIMDILSEAQEVEVKLAALDTLKTIARPVSHTMNITDNEFIVGGEQKDLDKS